MIKHYPQEIDSVSLVWAQAPVIFLSLLHDFNLIDNQGEEAFICTSCSQNEAPRTSSSIFTWKLVRNADSQASPQTCWVRNSGGWGPAICIFKSPPLGESTACSRVRTTDSADLAHLSAHSDFVWMVVYIISPSYVQFKCPAASTDHSCTVPDS